jgi:integrase
MAPDVARVLDALSRRDFCDSDDNVVFAGIDGCYLDASALYRRYKIALKCADLRELRFHDLRHTIGTTMIRNASIGRPVVGC